MHSAILVFSKNPECEMPNLDDKLDEVQMCNCCADYVGYEYSAESVKDCFYGDCYLKRIIPSKLATYSDGKLTVSANCQEDYKKWIYEHIKRVREWQDFKIFHSSASMAEFYMREVNVVTEVPYDWDTTEYLFCIASECDNIRDYASFLDSLVYHQGETLHLIGAVDYHF